MSSLQTLQWFFCPASVNACRHFATENVDPPDMKLGGLGAVLQRTWSQGQISSSPERSILPLGYGCISFNWLQANQSCIISFSIHNKSQKAINVSSSRDISFFFIRTPPTYLVTVDRYISIFFSPPERAQYNICFVLYKYIYTDTHHPYPKMPSIPLPQTRHALHPGSEQRQRSTENTWLWQECDDELSRKREPAGFGRVSAEWRMIFKSSFFVGPVEYV